MPCEPPISCQVLPHTCSCLVMMDAFKEFIKVNGRQNDWTEATYEKFHCCLPTANRIKKSGRIKKAITQIGRKIVVDKKMALELAGQPVYHRRGA